MDGTKTRGSTGLRGIATGRPLRLVFAGALTGVLAVGLAHPSVPAPDLRSDVFSLTGGGGHEITPERALPILVGFSDFDLNCRIELSPGSEVDLVFRRVTHQASMRVPIFYSRFAVMRLSSYRDGPGFLSREQALFESDLGGIRLSPGAPGASLVLKCRGRTAEAVVNGIVLESINTTDDFGSLAFLSRGGVALLHDLVITPWPRVEGRGAYYTGAILGGVVGLILALLGGSLLQVTLALGVGALGGLLGRWAVMDHLLPAVEPTAPSLVAAGLSLMPAALIGGLRMGRWSARVLAIVLVGSVACFAALESAARTEQDRLAAFADPRMDLYFGPESGQAPFDALARMLRCEYKTHVLLPPGERYDVLMLGGGRMFDHDFPNEGEKNIDLQLPELLRIRLGQPRDNPVNCAAIPTVLGYSYQQFLMFREFYKDYRPKVVVFGVTGEEAESVLPVPAREMLNPGPARSWSVLLDVHVLDSQTAVPTQSPGDLLATLRELWEFCQSADSKLVLAVDVGLPDAYRGVLTAFAESGEIPMVDGFDIDGGVIPVEALTRAVLTELIR